MVVQVCKLNCGSTEGQAMGEKLPDIYNFDANPEVLIGWLPAYQPADAETRDVRALGHYVALLEASMDDELRPVEKIGEVYHGTVQIHGFHYEIFDGGMLPWGKTASIHPLDLAAKEYCAQRQVCDMICFWS